MKRFFRKHGILSVSLAVCAALALAAGIFSCDGLQNDVTGALLFDQAPQTAATNVTETQGSPSGGTPVQDQAAAPDILWEGVQTLSGEVLQDGIMPAEFALAPASDVSKSIFPTPPAASSLTYTVGGTATINGKAVTASGTFNKTTNKYSIDLPYATGGTDWDITISAKTSGGSVVLKKTETVTIDSRSPASTPFQLEYSTSSTDGLGVISFDIGYDTTSAVSAITVFFNNSSVGSDLTLDSGTANYTIYNVTPGPRDIKIVFYDSAGTAIYAIVEKALVYANMTTNKFVGTAPYISSGSVSVSATEISNMATASADGGIWLGGTGIVSGAAANDANDGTKFAPVATLYRAFAIANALAALDSSKTYTINVQGNVVAGTSSNKTATLNATTKVLLKGTSASASSYKSIKGSSGTYQISSSSASLECQYLIFDYLGGFTVAGGETTMNYCKVQNGQSATDTIAGGITVRSGAAFNSTASLTITACSNTISAGGMGGGVYCLGTLNLKGTTIQKCKASGVGGGIFIDGSATVTLDGCMIGESSASAASSTSLCSNYADLKGGGIYIASSSDAGVTIKGSTTISYNYARNGGGIYGNGGKLSLSKTTVQRNGTASDGKGGGIYLYKTYLSFVDTDCEITNNTAAGTTSSACGGGLYLSSYVASDMTINGTFKSNSAYSGGAIYSESPKKVTLGSDCAIGANGAANTATNGGGVYSKGSGGLFLSGATISYNSASAAGGGLYNDTSKTATFSSGTISNNTAEGTSATGGGIYNGGTLTMNGDATVSDNSAGGNGGGIYNGSTLKLGYKNSATTDSWAGSVSNNSSSKNGGGIYNAYLLYANNATFDGNSAAEKGNAIYIKRNTTTGPFTLSGQCKFVNTATEQSIFLYGINYDSVTVSSMTLASGSGKVILEPNYTEGYIIGKTVIASGVTSESYLSSNFSLPENLQMTYGLKINGSAAKLDIKTPALNAFSGGTVSENVGNGAFKNAGTTPVTVGPIKMARYEVTYELWYAVYQWAINQSGAKKYTFGSCGKEGDNPNGSEAKVTTSAPPTTEIVNVDEGRGGQRPVTNVSWRDAIVWCNAYSEYTGLTPVYYIDEDYGTILRSCNDSNTTSFDTAGSQDCPYIYSGPLITGNTDMANCTADGARLPTEAEWEFAARGENPSRPEWSYEYTMFSAVADLGKVAWYSGNSGSVLHCVGIKDPTIKGIRDMLGNVSEWCHDIADSTKRREKGGNALASETSSPPGCNVSYQGGSNPYRTSPRSGFRFAQNQ